jgi:hypothetical protein
MDRIDRRDAEDGGVVAKAAIADCGWQEGAGMRDGKCLPVAGTQEGSRA